MQKAKLHLDVIVDVVCPWCFLGKRRLDAAIAELDDLDIEVRYRPFQLDPDTPKEGIDRESYIIGKFGSPDALDEAPISTLHGWCQRILREQALLSGEPFQPRILQDTAALRLEAVRDWLDPKMKV